MDLLNTFASESKKHGIKIVENCEVTKILVKTTRGGQYFKVRGVETTLGNIECDIFVNCTGIVSVFWNLNMKQKREELLKKNDLN